MISEMANLKQQRERYISLMNFAFFFNDSHNTFLKNCSNFSIRRPRVNSGQK